MSDLTPQIEENAQGPAQASGDQGSIQQHGLRDQVEADRYLKEQAAQGKKKLPIRLTQFRPGGTV